MATHQDINRPDLWHPRAAGAPLQAYNKLRSHSTDATQQFVSSVFCPHRLEPFSKHGDLNAEMNHAPLSQLSLNYLKYGAPVLVEPGELSSFFLVLIQLTGTVNVRCGRQAAQLDAGHATVLSPTEYTCMDWTGDADELILRVARPDLERFLSTLLGHSLRRPLVFDLAMDCKQGAGAAWRRGIDFLLFELESQVNLLTWPLVVANYEHMLMSSLLHAQPHNYTDELARTVSPAAPRHVKFVEDYIAAHADEPITIEDLTTVSGVSVRTLFAGFQRFRGTSPMKHLRDVRLARARADLQMAVPNVMAPNVTVPNVTVTEVALKWGFTQLGRFSVEYKRQYGESPSETLRRCAVQ